MFHFIFNFKKKKKNYPPLCASIKNHFLAFLINLFCFFQVVVPKSKGEILGVVIVESGWGSMLPTIVLANLAPGGPAARCGQLNIGDQVPWVGSS